MRPNLFIYNKTFGSGNIKTHYLLFIYVWIIQSYHRRQIRENIQQISQRVDNLNNPIQILRNQNRNANQELVFGSNFFQIRLHRALRQNPRFNETNSSHEINFRNLPNNHNTLQGILYTSIRELIRISFGDQKVNLRLAIYHDDLETPIGFPYMRRQDITTEMILAKFLLVAQSNRNLRIENNLIISASSIEEIVGGSCRLWKFIYKKQSIIQITNNDNLCACRAKVVGIAHNNYLIDPEKKNLWSCQGKIHVCDGRWCLNCSKAVNLDQKCCILTQEERDKIKKRSVNGEIKNQTKGYIFFDYESMNVDGLHIPNLIIADKICFDCIDRWRVN